MAADIRRQWKWHLDEMYVKLNGEMIYLWRTADDEAYKARRSAALAEWQSLMS